MSRSSILRWYFTLAAVEGLAALIAILAARSEADSAWLLGYSRSRLALAFAALAATTAFGLLARRAWRAEDWANKLAGKIQNILGDNRAYLLLLGAASAIFLACLYLALLAGKFTDAFVQARLLGLLPIFLWLAALDAQTLVAAPLLRNEQGFAALQLDKGLTGAALIAFALLGLLAAFILITRWGLSPDRTGWDDPGTPLLAAQIFLAWLVSIVGWGIFSRLATTLPKRIRIDTLIAFLLWAIAAFAWKAVPARPSYFAPDPRLPNYETYPYSDAALQDLIAQNLLLGEGYKPIAEKPLYSLLLAGIHLVVGQDYMQTVNLQILLLAVFPAVVYLLGALSRHRLAGLIAAALVILREMNSIALSGRIGVSHSKLLMTDLPTALFLAFFAYLVALWLGRWRERRMFALVCGGVLGITVLLRSQSILLAPVILVAMLMAMAPNWKRFAEAAGLFALGLALAVVPWMWRNYSVTGQFGYAQPLQALYLAKQYNLTPELGDPGFPPGTPVEEYASLGFGKALAFAREYPGVVAQFISAHFLHNEVSTVLALPSAYPLADNMVEYYNLSPYWQDRETALWQYCCGLEADVTEAPYWSHWDGRWPDEAILPVWVNLALIALGIAAAWRHGGVAGLVPLFLHLGYSLSVAVARVSGWRLILPVDWVGLLYFSIGLAQVSLMVWAFLSGKRLATSERPTQVEQTVRLSVKRLVGTALVILALGASVPLAESLIPARYSAISEAEVFMLLTSTGNEIGDLEQAWLEDEGRVTLRGLTFYPRYYAAGQGEPGSETGAYATYEYGHLGFMLAGPDTGDVVLPLDAAPEYFPNAAEVIILGCRVGDYVQAQMVILLQNPEIVIESSLTCEPVGE